MTKAVFSPTVERRLRALERLVRDARLGTASAGVGLTFAPDGRAILPGGALVGAGGLVAGSPPPAPSTLVLTPGADAGDVFVDVDWTPGAITAAGPITAWAVEVLRDGDTLPLVLHPTADLAPPNQAYRVHNLDPNTLYHFAVRAITQLGASSTTLTGDTTTGYDTAAPSNVTGLAADAGYVTITASWTPLGTTLAPFTGRYLVEIATNAGFTTGVADYDAGSANVFTITGLTTGQDYYLRVRARSSSGVDGSWTSGVGPITPGSVTASISSDGIVPAANPSSGSITGGVGYILVQWAQVANADPITYEVHISTTNSFTPSSSTLVAKVPQVQQTAGGLMFAFIKQANAAGSALTYGTTYYFTVVATDADGTSGGARTYGSGSMAPAVSADIAAGTIVAANIAAGTITANEIAAATITAAKIVAGTITGTLIAAGAITTAHMTAGTISADRLTSGSVTATQIAANTITAASGIIASIDATKITTNQMDVARLGAGTIGAYLIQLGSGGTIRSANYVAGSTGWNMDGAGNLEANNATIRGVLAAASFSGTDFTFYDSGGLHMLRLLHSGSNHWLQLGDGINSGSGLYWDTVSNRYVFEAGSATNPSWQFTGNVKFSGTIFADGSIAAGGGAYTGGFFANTGGGAMDTNWGVGFQSSGGTVYTRVNYYGDASNDRRAGFINAATGAWVAYADTFSAWVVPSSVKIKKKIVAPVTDVVAQLSALQVVEYERVGDDSGHKHYGLIAEDTAKVAPELVAFGPDGSAQGIYTEARDALMLRGWQEHEKRLQALEGKGK